MFKRLMNNKETPLTCPVDGYVTSVTEVDDEMFSTKMLGDGFAVKPNSNEIYSPITGTITSVFPTLHAIGILGPQGEEVLVHIGIDTVELDGIPFQVKFKANDTVTPQDIIAVVDFEYIQNKGKSTDVIVVCTNGGVVNLTNSKHHYHGIKIGSIASR